MSYLYETRNRVITFLKRRKKVFQTELQYLGTITMQIKLSTLLKILYDLEEEGLIKREEFKIGKKLFKEIRWKG